MSFLRKRGKSKKWYLYYRENGRLRAIPISTEWSVADNYKKRFDYDQTCEKLDLPKKATAWIDFESTYLNKHSKPPSKSLSTHMIDIRALRSFRLLIKPQHVSDLNFNSLEQWRTMRSNEKVKAATVNIELGQLKAASTYAFESGLTTKNLCGDVAKLPVQENNEHKIITPKQIQRLKVEAGKFDDDLGLMAKFFLYSGLRVNEIIHLRFEDIDISGGWGSITEWGDYRPKNKQKRKFPLHSELVPALRSRLKANGAVGGLLFPGRSGGVRNKSAVIRRFNRIYERAGIDLTGCHLLRHTFTTNALEANIDPPTVQSWLGHSSLNTTMIYHRKRDEHSQKMIKKLGR